MSRRNIRPLVMRCGAMGDMVLLLPLIRQLSARFGTPVDIVSSGSWTQPLLTGQPGIGELFLIRSRRRPFVISPDQWRLVDGLRRRGPGPTWFLDPDAVGSALLARAGIGAEWIVDAADFPRRPGEHYLERWARVAQQSPPALGCGVSAQAAEVLGTELIVPAAGYAALIGLLHRHGLADRRMLLVQAGNKRTMRRGNRRRPSNNKYWPEENWAALIRAMRARCPQHAIVLTGVDSERALNDDILARLAPRECDHIHNVAGELPMPVLLALLDCADGIVGVDTGPAHAAAALGVPQVVLFGSADPAYYRPWGAPAAMVSCVKGDADRPLASVPVSEAVAAWRALALRVARHVVVERRVLPLVSPVLA
jgi:hypothetical protein